MPSLTLKRTAIGARRQRIANGSGDTAFAVIEQVSGVKVTSHSATPST